MGRRRRTDDGGLGVYEPTSFVMACPWPFQGDGLRMLGSGGTCLGFREKAWLGRSLDEDCSGQSG